MKETLLGLVIRAADQGENGKYLTLLTKNGKRYVSVSGARGIKSQYIGTSQLCCYAEYQVEIKNGRTYLREAARIENFYEIFDDVVKTAFASYMCEIAQQICMENNDESEMLSLLLNILYVLVTSSHPTDLVKAVFETRVLSIQGVAPDLAECHRCGKTDDSFVYLDVMNGGVLCPDCLVKEQNDAGEVAGAEDGTARILLPLEYPVRQALGYVLACPPKRIFAFSLEKEWYGAMERVSECYLLNHLECRTQSLAMYKEMRNLSKGGTGTT